MKENKTNYDSDSDVESQKDVSHKVSVVPHDDGDQCNRSQMFTAAKPFGVFSFTLTTTLVSLLNIHAGNVSIPNVVVGLGICKILKLRS